jgi:hypothetical protein
MNEQTQPVAIPAALPTASRLDDATGWGDVRRPWFKEDYEKYDWLMEWPQAITGEDREWIAWYRTTPEWKAIYGHSATHAAALPAASCLDDSSENAAERIGVRRPMFSEDCDKYDWLMARPQAITEEDHEWIAWYRTTSEWKDIYGHLESAP